MVSKVLLSYFFLLLWRTLEMVFVKLFVSAAGCP